MCVVFFSSIWTCKKLFDWTTFFFGRFGRPTTTFNFCTLLSRLNASTCELDTTILPMHFSLSFHLPPVLSPYLKNSPSCGYLNTNTDHESNIFFDEFHFTHSIYVFKNCPWHQGMQKKAILHIAAMQLFDLRPTSQTTGCLSLKRFEG